MRRPAARPPRPAPAPRPGAFTRHGLATLALGLAVLLAYANSLDAGWVLDGDLLIRQAPRVHEARWSNVVDILTTDYWSPGNSTGNYRPVTTLSYMLNWAVLGNGDRPQGYHWVNLLLHWANAVLVYAVSLRVLGLARRAAFFVALLFATHPIATEAVTNIVGRADLVSAASVLGGLLLYFKATRAATGPARFLWLSALGAVEFLGLLSKENAIVLVAAVVLYDLVFRLDLTAARGAEPPASRLWSFARTGWVALLPPLAALWLIRAQVYGATPPTETDFGRNPLAALDPWTARLTALKVVGRSFWLLAWPRTLCPDYSVDAVPLFGWQWLTWQDAQALLAFLGVAAALLVAVKLRGRAPAASYYLLFLLVAVLPTSNLLFPIGALMAERFLYLPLFGFCGCLVLAAEALAERIGSIRAPAPRDGPARHGGPRAVAHGGLALLAVVYGARTVARNADWRDELTLWSRAVESCPSSFLSHAALAGAVASAPQLGDLGTRIDRTIELQETAQAILERHTPPGAKFPPDVLAALGSAYLTKARLEAERARAPRATHGAGSSSAKWAEKAVAPFERVIAQFGIEWAERARRERARTGEDREFGDATLYSDLGHAWLLAGRPERALEAFRRARSLGTRRVEAYEDLAAAYVGLGRAEEALLSLLEAMLVEPRPSHAAAVLELYQRVDPGGCGFGRGPSGLTVNRECKTGRVFLCRAYSDLISVILAARDAPGAQRRTAAEAFRRRAEEGLHCSELGHAELRATGTRAGPPRALERGRAAR